jgi:hypothetical protein
MKNRILILLTAPLIISCTMSCSNNQTENDKTSSVEFNSGVSDTSTLNNKTENIVLNNNSSTHDYTNEKAEIALENIPSTGKYVFVCNENYRNDLYIELLPNSKFKAIYEECEIIEVFNGDYSLISFENKISFYPKNSKLSFEFTYFDNIIYPSEKNPLLHCANVGCDKSNYYKLILDKEMDKK